MNLQDAILNHNRELASDLAKSAELFAKTHLKKGLLSHLSESLFALVFALLFAIVIRQTWFELYEIPSGSMRPTFKEQDRLVVSKTQFGLNIPLSTSHLLFSPAEVKRMGVITFTGKNMDIRDAKTRYFYLFPGYKQYVKRMIGLPGDTLYFYGGKIYGLDKEGNDISQDLQKEELSYLEHIPFIFLEGNVSAAKSGFNNIFSPVILHQMNEPLAKLYTSVGGRLNYELLLPPNKNSEADLSSLDLYDYWGMGNYASSRIVKQSALYQDSSFDETLYPGAKYFLELSHHASLKHGTIGLDYLFRERPQMRIHKSYIPLGEKEMKKIWDNLYTARFVVENGAFRRYGSSKSDLKIKSFRPKLVNQVPDGTYEMQNGKKYRVLSQGILKELPSNHPLATYNEENLLTLYNLGINCDMRFIFQHKQGLRPARYAYFRNGELYLMGVSIFQKDHPLLEKFVSLEVDKSEAFKDYAPFIDNGAPLNADGSINKETIRNFGISVPDKHYMVLGDNHAMSGDSREFGFVPEENIRGVPGLVFWAPNDRFGITASSFYPTFTPARIAVWICFGFVSVVWGTIHYRRNRLPLNFD